MQARVETSVEGGTVEIVYTTDPRTVDGLSQEELAETIVGLIPAVIASATYPDFAKQDVAQMLRSIADMWDPEYTYIDDRSLCDDVRVTRVLSEPVTIEDYTYWEGEH
jgi:hypothetical protein